MNLWLRLIWYLSTAWRRPALSSTHEVSRVTFVVWPTDLDVSLHMNNGRYLTIMDIGRLDFMVRTGALAAIAQAPLDTDRQWHRHQIPARTSRVRPVRAGDPALDLERCHGRHGAGTALSNGPRTGQAAARALFKGGLYDRRTKSFLPISRLMQELGVEAVAPPMTAEVEAFLRADEAIRAGSNPTY